MFGALLENVRRTCPLIHNITNYVTVNDCANILLACGASPIMADDAEEAEEITSICQGLNLNIGTLNQRTIPAMIKAGKRAAELGHTILLDPVGAGASALRTRTARRLMEEIPLSVIRGNISEIRALALGAGTTKGVDADAADCVTEETMAQTIAFAEAFAKKTQAVIAITGAADIVTDGLQTFCIRSGHPMMRRVTGTGCQLSAMMTAFAAANAGKRVESCAAAAAAMGVCGEKAYERLTEADGNASYRNYIIDAVYRLTPEELERRAEYEVYRRNDASVCSDRQGVDRKADAV